MSALVPLDAIEAAAARLGDAIHHTPVMHTRQLGARAGVELWLKAECLQKTGSFKARGALHKVLCLSAAERARGLCTVSAGNHAQAVAWAAARAAAPCTVVMPEGAPQSKVDAVRGYGASIVFHPDRATLFERLEQVRRETGATFVHPFDDPVVLAGAGTCGLEIADALPDVDAVVVPVGGGGLMSGVTSAVRQRRPRVRVIAVELAEGPGMAPALAAGKPVPVPRPRTIADGMTPPFVGAIPMAIAREAVDRLVTVTEQEILAALALLLTRAKLVAEGSGAAATAAVLAGRGDLAPGARVCAIVSGGNIDLSTLCAAVAPA